MSPVSLVNGAFHLHIICTVELDWLQSARGDWYKFVECIMKMVFMETDILCVTVLISVRHRPLLRSWMATQ